MRVYFIQLITIIYFYIVNTISRNLRVQEHAIEFSIDENCPIGTEIGMVQTGLLINSPLSSPGSMINSNSNELNPISNLIYQLGSPSNLFSIDERKGLLTTKSAIDAEQLCAQVRRQKSDQLNIEKGYDTGQSLGDQHKLSSAEDIISCSTSGELIVRLNVNAMQADGSLRAVLQVSIKIHDLNDNGPKFDQIRWHKRVKEVLYRSGRRIDLPKARDDDLLAEHNRINYRLESWHEGLPVSSSFIYRGPFRLEVSSTSQPYLILTEDLDAENMTRHQFILVAYSPYNIENKNQFFISNDQNMQQISRLEIDIEVADMNDNEPRFTSNQYNVSVKEDTAIGTVIYKLIAHDPDSTARLTYSMGKLLEPNIMNNIFHIEIDGHVRLKSSLDYESKHIYSIPVEVSDGEFSAKTILNVHVQDVNDEPPVFELNPKQLIADENASAGKLIGRVRIRDPDSETVNGIVECHEPKGLQRNQALQFLPDPSVNPTSQVYDLSTRVILDRENMEYANPGYLTIYLICSDGGNLENSQVTSNETNSIRLTSTMTATLTIRDVNDHSPVFEKSVYHVQVRENNPIGEKIVQVTAHDADDGDNARITYSLLDRANFKVDSLTGWITTNVIFDRETRDSYQVTILAMDQGKPRLSTSVLLNITVLDVNDHSPILLPYEADETIMKSMIDLPIGRYKDNNLFIILENMPPNTYLGQILAVDKDEGLNAKLNFKLLSNNNNNIDNNNNNNQYNSLFKVTPNGSLFTTTELDREEKDHYQLVVVVTDQSTTEPLSTTGTIGIIVLDVNDNYPRFVQPKGLLNPNVTRMNDYSHHLNSNLINNNKTNSGALLYDQPSEDMSGNDLKDNKKRSYLGDTNSASNIAGSSTSNSKLPEPVIRLSMHENPGLIISTLYAEDPDAGDNGKIFYLLEEVYGLLTNEIKPNPLIRVKPDSGELILLRLMNSADLGYHFFQVTASDRGHPKMKMDKKIMSVLVEDIPATGGSTQSLFSSSYYMNNVTGLDINNWNWNSGKNIMLIIILSSVSGLLATILIVAIVCVTGSCSRNSHHRRIRRHDNNHDNNHHTNGLSNRPVTSPGSSDVENSIIPGNDAFLNGSQNHYGYGDLHFQTASNRLTTGLIMEEWRQQFRDDESNCNNMVYPYYHGSTNADYMNDINQHSSIVNKENDTEKSQNQETIFNLVDNSQQYVYENLAHKLSPQMNDDFLTSPKPKQPIAVRILSPTMLKDNFVDSSEHMHLPRSNRLSGIAIQYPFGSSSSTSVNSNRPLGVTVKSDCFNTFCVTKPVPVVSKLNFQRLENEGSLIEVNPMITISTAPFSTDQVLSDEIHLSESNGNNDYLINTSSTQSPQNCLFMTLKPHSNPEVNSVLEEHNTSDSGRGGSEEELLLNQLGTQLLQNNLCVDMKTNDERSPFISVQSRSTDVWNQPSVQTVQDLTQIILNQPNDLNLSNPWFLTSQKSATDYNAYKSDCENYQPLNN